MKNDKSFVGNIQEIRQRARAHIERGPVTESYNVDRETVVRLCNEALATEIVCVLRYKRHYFMAQGVHAEPVAQQFLEHANEEQNHADRLAERITQLGGEPDLNPQVLAQQSHTEYVEGKTLVDMIKEDLVAERIVIEIYREVIRYLDNGDPTTRRLFEEILANEEEHADELTKMLTTMHPGDDR